MVGLKSITVKMGMFDFSVRCLIGKQEDAEKIIRTKLELDEDFDSGYQARGKTYFRTGYVPIIWIPKRPKTPLEYSTLAHECIHAMMYLYDWTGMEVNPGNEEVLCHGTAHLMRTILEKSK